jgi:hypothetical protein
MRFRFQLSCLFIRNAPGSNLSSVPEYLDLRLFSFSLVSKQMARQYFKSGHDQFHPFPFHFTFYQMSHHSMSEPLAAVLIKRRKIQLSLEQDMRGQRGIMV